MAAIGVNFLITFLFFREPVTTSNEKSSLVKNILQAFVNIGITLKNWKYVLFLIIMVLFWAACNQLYYSFPVFIDQWVNTGMLYDGIHRCGPAAVPSDETEINSGNSQQNGFLFIIVFH
jgi:Na+/melibiose symporter-like transporter